MPPYLFDRLTVYCMKRRWSPQIHWQQGVVLHYKPTATEEQSDLRMKFIASPSLGCLEVSIKGMGSGNYVADVMNVFEHMNSVVGNLFHDCKAKFTVTELGQNTERALVVRVNIPSLPFSSSSNTNTNNNLSRVQSQRQGQP